MHSRASWEVVHPCCSCTLVADWVKAVPEPNQELLGLAQAAIQVPQGDTWQCPIRATAPSPTSRDPTSFPPFKKIHVCFQVHSFLVSSCNSLV